MSIIHLYLSGPAGQKDALADYLRAAIQQLELPDGYAVDLSATVRDYESFGNDAPDPGSHRHGRQYMATVLRLPRMIAKDDNPDEMSIWLDAAMVRGGQLLAANAELRLGEVAGRCSLNQIGADDNFRIPAATADQPPTDHVGDLMRWNTECTPIYLPDGDPVTAMRTLLEEAVEFFPFMLGMTTNTTAE